MLPVEIAQAVKRIQFVTGRQVADVMAGAYLSVFKGRGMEFDEVRPYVPGDDVRSIDWNVTARTGEPHIKRFVEERELTVMLLVDVSASQDFGSGRRSKLEAAVELSALLALSAVENGDKVGMLLFHGGADLYIPPRKGQKHALRVIRDLVAFKPRGRGTNLADALGFASKLLHHRAIVAVLSDFRAEGWEDPLARLAGDHDIVAITIDDPRERAFPDAGWVDFSDSETGQRVLVDTSNPRTRARLQVAAERLAQERSRKLTQAGVDRVMLRTDVPYGVPLRRAFAARARRLQR